MGRSSSDSGAVQAPPATHVTTKIVENFGDRLAEKAICLTTPIPKLVPLSKLGLQAALQKFLTRYEPRVGKSGLYEHQASIAKALSKSKIPNVVMTTATG